MRIGWVIHGHERYGVRTATLAITDVARSLGVEPCFLCLGRGDFYDELSADPDRRIELIADKAPPPPRGGLLGKLLWPTTLPRYGKQLRDRLREAVGQYECVALHLTRPTQLWVVPPNLATPRPPIFWEMPNVIASAVSARWYRVACRRWGVRPLPNSAFTERSLRGGLETHVIYPPVDVHRWDPEPVEPIDLTGIGVPGDAAVVAIAAQLKPRKGQRVLIEAFAGLSVNTTPPHLVIIGGGDAAYRQGLEELVRRLGLDDRVHFTGESNEVPRYFRAADVVVNARTDPEPYGLTVVEAMSMGKPVVAHALGGPSETVLDGQTGWLFPEPTPEALRAALQRAFDARSRWPEIGDAARRRATDEYSYEAAAIRYRRALAHAGLSL
ncbi:MAG: glycosyltransferase [Planctomycetota bacterium]